ncbi:MAG: polysaccharide deacetylase family protein [Deltaproteobacteria bacterium]|nr:polysaccharide deacetylase family protein [Deltaproteobacteria bacterium]MDQ3296781.1 polysaccharide deacetylase family protein [Myxococcota bacterium]
MAVSTTPSVRALVKNVVFQRLPGCLRRGPTTTKRVALTFDDGPDDYTERYLDVLDDLGVPATFFLIGEYATARPELVREYLRRGHQVANHGYDHTRFTKLGRRALLDQLAKTEDALGGQLSGRPWVRPPHGSVDATSLVSLLASGYTIALWSVDACDYDDHDTASIVERCSPPNVDSGDVLLLHEGQQWTLDALPRIVTALHASGYECVTMHDLFAE